MDLSTLKDVTQQATDLHNSTSGLSMEIFGVSFFIYHKVWKKISAKVSTSFQSLLKSLEIHSNTLNEHSKKLDAHAKNIDNHEKRIGVLETDVGQLKTKP